MRLAPTLALLLPPQENEGFAGSQSPWEEFGSSVKLRGQQQRGLLARLGSQRFVLQSRNMPDGKGAGAKGVKLPGLRRYERFDLTSDSVNY